MTTSSPPALFAIDVKAFYERHGCIVAGKPTNSKEGKEYAASCPRCGGTDRFSFWDSGRFCCIRGNCGNWHGSNPYWFLREEGYDHRSACADLDIDPSELFGSDSYSQATPLPLYLIRDEPPVQKWIDSAHAFCQLAERCLWGPKGVSALKYLQSRGFTDATIKAAHLGLCPDWHKAPLSDWGLDASQLNKNDDPQIKIPRGITIPWYVEGSIWKIQIRRPEPGPTGSSYFEILGSAECHYNSDAFRPGQPVLLVESELDALSAQQEAGDLVACVATGSTTKGLTGRWVARLKLASHVLQSFDDDEAGERGFVAWQKALKEDKITRWRPYAHDVNDMLKTGDSIRQWVEQGLETAQEDELPLEAEQGGEENFEEEQLAAMPLEAVTEAPSSPPALTYVGMSSTEYIDQWYRLQAAQQRSTQVRSDDNQVEYWAGVHARLEADGWYEYFADETVKQAERICHIASLPFVPPRTSPETERHAPPALTQTPEETDAMRIERYRLALKREKKKHYHLAKPLLERSAFALAADALKRVSEALLGDNPARREAALDEMYYREHGSYRNVR